MVHRYLLLRGLPVDKKNRDQFMSDLRHSKSIFTSLRYSHTFKGIYSSEKLRQKVLEVWEASPRFLLLFSEALQHTYLVFTDPGLKASSQKKFSEQKNMLTNYKSESVSK